MRIRKMKDDNKTCSNYLLPDTGILKCNESVILVTGATGTVGSEVNLIQLSK